MRRMLFFAWLLFGAAVAAEPLTVRVTPETVGPGGEATITVILSNTAMAPRVDTLTIRATVTYLDAGQARQSHGEATVRVQRDAPGGQWENISISPPQPPGMTIDWSSLTFTGRATAPRLEWDERVPYLRADSLPWGAVWESKYTIRDAPL